MRVVSGRTGQGPRWSAVKGRDSGCGDRESLETGRNLSSTPNTDVGLSKLSGNYREEITVPPKSIMAILLLVLDVDASAADKFDIQVCEAQPSDASKIGCYGSLRLNTSCNNLEISKRLSCYRKSTETLLVNKNAEYSRQRNIEQNSNQRLPGPLAGPDSRTDSSGESRGTYSTPPCYAKDPPSCTFNAMTLDLCNEEGRKSETQFSASERTHIPGGNRFGAANGKATCVVSHVRGTEPATYDVKVTR
jgi:hypothetical protein